MKPQRASTLLGQFVPKHVLLSEFSTEQNDASRGTKAPAALDSLNFYATAKSRVLAGAEPDSLASVRCQVSGKRTVLITDKKALAEFMINTKGAAYSPADLGTYFLQMQQAEFDKYVDNHKIYSIVLEPGNVLFTPTCSMVAEKVEEKADSLGLRVCCLPCNAPKVEESALVYLMSGSKTDSPSSRFWAFLVTYQSLQK
jgi:hypothetical protein